MIRMLLAVSVVVSARSMCAAEMLPEDAGRLVAEHDEKAAAIRKEAEGQLDRRRAEVIRSLEALQLRYAKDGKLDEALAIRARIRELKGALFPVGAQVEVEWHEHWWPAHVLEAGPNTWHIGYTGYGDEWNEWVPRTRIRMPEANAPK